MNRVRALAGAVLILAGTAAAAERIQSAAFAGQFYEKDPVRLAAQVDWFLTNAGTPASGPGKILAVVVPHAAYVYSGGTAAAAYALVRGGPFESVVIIGPSHRLAFEGCSIYPDGGFETPLGIVPVDAGLAREIGRASGFAFVPDAFDGEHSVEVQVPFVQRALPKARIVPVVMGRQNKSTVQALAAGLAKACAGKRVLVVASTDLSHFFPKAKASEVDAGTISLVQSLKTDALLRKIEAGDNIMCGGGPVVSALLYARKQGAARVEILRHSDSSDSGGPSTEVVGYLAAAVLEGGEAPPEEFTLTAEDRIYLLRLARSAVTEFVGRGAVIDDPTRDPKLLSPKGVFVTIKKRGELRGCIGFIEPIAPLSQAVIRAAVYAAAEDPRFPPVEPSEIKDLSFELSVLTPIKEVGNCDLVQVGRHGIVVSRGVQKGLLLPQVPVENGWDRETFLREGCLKAGLPPDAWRKGAKVCVFEAIVFHEE
jgi:AmmeMemoRadiSam system protein B/AmmeMemoRadiSam system protein A